MNMFNLQGKNVLLTGASGGLGEGIAKNLIENGVCLTISGTRQAYLEKMANELGGQIHIAPCNLSDQSEVDQLIPKCEQLMGSIDILINNAGITRDNLLMRMKDEEFTDVININLEAPFRLMRSVVRGMLKRRWGRIINITSIVGVTGNPGQANYAASKAGIIGFSKSLAAEVATRNITVNCIAPGFMTSPMTDQLTEPQKEKLLTSIPMNRMGTAQDIAAACLFFASNEANYITGQTLHVNGGMAMI